MEQNVVGTITEKIGDSVLNDVDSFGRNQAFEDRFEIGTQNGDGCGLIQNPARNNAEPSWRFVIKKSAEVTTVKMQHHACTEAARLKHEQRVA